MKKKGVLNIEGLLWNLSLHVNLGKGAKTPKLLSTAWASAKKMADNYKGAYRFMSGYIGTR